MGSKFFAVLTIGAMLALPASALAQTSSQGAYNQPGGVVQDQIEAKPTAATSDDERTPPAATAAVPAAQSDDGGTLPFTGLDLGLVVAAGGVLLLMGFGIRRFTRATDLA